MPYKNVPADKTDLMDRCVMKVKGTGKDDDAAYAICFSSVMEDKTPEWLQKELDKEDEPIKETEPMVEVDPIRLAEEVTIKARAKAALKSISDLLVDKTLTDELRKQIESVREALKKNWSDLEADADLEGKSGRTGKAINQSKEDWGGAPYNPMNPNLYTFEQLKAINTASETQQEIIELTQQFNALTYNIVNFLEGDKLGALNILWAEFIVEMEGLLSNPPMEKSELKPVIDPPVLSENQLPIETLQEDYNGYAQLIEAVGGDTLAYMDVQVIRPGWGNTRDNHYYSQELLKKDAGQFIGSKMFETDHRQDEKSTRTWVSTIKEITGFTQDGSPIARVAIHDPGFAERVKNLAKAGLIEKMECSILANGTAKPGFEMDGRKGKAVESITEVLSVDWVTKAGAGGHAMNLAEADVKSDIQLEAHDVINEKIVSSNPSGTLPVVIVEEKPIPLSGDEVMVVLGEYKLPAVVSNRLVGKTFYTVHQVKETIQSEIEYLKQVTGSGSPFGLAESKTQPVSLEEINRRKDAVNKKYLG